MALVLFKALTWSSNSQAEDRLILQKALGSTPSIAEGKKIKTKHKTNMWG